jgi:hypothetical protein
LVYGGESEEEEQQHQEEEHDSDADVGEKVPEIAPEQGGGKVDVDELDFEEEEGEATDPHEQAGTRQHQKTHLAFELRDYPPKLPAAVLEAALKRLPSFKRIAIRNPTRTSDRRAIVTFSANDATLREIQASLRGMRVPGFENSLPFLPYSSRPPSVRVPGDMVYRHHPDDAKLLLQLVELYDKSFNTWSDAANPLLDEGPSLSLVVYFWSFSFPSSSCGLFLSICKFGLPAL